MFFVSWDAWWETRKTVVAYMFEAPVLVRISCQMCFFVFSAWLFCFVSKKSRSERAEETQFSGNHERN